MKLNILKTEVAFQTLLSLGSFLYLVINHNKQDQASDFFIALFFIGVANLLGFLIRISLVASKFHRYYFLGVILFFLLLFGVSLLTMDSKVESVMNFMGIGGILFNIYYLAYSFYLIRNFSIK